MRIKDFCNINSSSITSKDEIDTILYLDTSNLTENEIGCLQTFVLSEAPSRAQRKVKHNTILYSMVRPNQKHYGIMNNPSDNVIASTGFVTIDIKDEERDNYDAHFLYYILTQNWVTSYLQTIAENSVSSYPSINPSDIENLNFTFPKVEVQRQIAAVLRNIDDKIALNKSINQNLEALAKQIYDYWFVQFDFPNEENKPYKSSGGMMVWNEKLKREIPKGWVSDCMETFLTIKNGRDHKHLSSGDYPVYGSGGEMRRVSEYLYNGESVLMPRKGSLNNIMFVNQSFWTVDTMFYSEMKIPHCAKYVYFTIKDIDFTRWDSGTGVPSMTASTLYSIPMVKPNEAILQRFDTILEPLYQKLKQVQLENESLVKQRDELLPLLMNGQVSINSDLWND